MDDETWVPVGPVEYAARYQVSNLGRVRRAATGPNTRKGKILRPALTRSGHPIVKLSAGGISRGFQLASLVADAFLPPGPPGAILKHRDGDRSNCAAGNLTWAPKSDPETRGGRRRNLSDGQAAEVLALRGVLPGTTI